MDKRVTTAGEFNFQFCLRRSLSIFHVSRRTRWRPSVCQARREHADDNGLANKISRRNTNNSRITCLLNSLRNHALSLVTWHPPQKIKNLRPQIQLYRTKLTYFTMSSPNMNASSILRNQSSRTTSFSTNLSGMETVFVGLLQSYLYDFVIWTIEMIVPVLTVRHCK
mgnify:CR=1 FL=1